MRSMDFLRWSAACGSAALVITACDGPAEPAAVHGSPAAVVASQASRAFIVRGASGQLPADLAAGVGALGGTLTAALPQIGVALARGGPDLGPRLAALPGVAAAVPDAEVQWIEPVEPTALVLAGSGYPPNSGEADELYDLQWGAAAIDHPIALAAGHTGGGVRVCILDSGIRSTHLDLAPNLNTALSTSFVVDPAEAFDDPPGGHGTHVAGIVAAARNAMGTIGVAPDAEIVVIKILRASTGSGEFGWLVQALVHAAENGCDVANMSVGALVSRSGFADANDEWIPAAAVAEIVVALQRAANYAHNRGVTLIAAAGNDAVDLDADGDQIQLPAQLAHVIAVAATGPVGWALDPDTDLDRTASYTNYGLSAIDFAAPGGDFELPGFDSCTIGSELAQCRFFDTIISTGVQSDDGYAFNIGTSMAAPHVAGVAALIIGRNGGPMTPAQVEAALRRSTDQPDGSGKSSFYGFGRVNAGRAVQ